MKKVLWLIAVMLTSSVIARDNKESVRYLDVSDQFNALVATNRKLHHIAIIDRASESEVRYSPNINAGLGAGINYQGLGLTIFFSVTENDDSIYGNTSNYDIRIESYLKRWILDVQGQYHKGYYIQNIEDLNPNWPGGVYPQLEDLQSWRLGGKMLYVFSPHKISLKAAYLQNQIQTRSGGSALLGGFFDYFRVEDPKTMIPKPLETRFDQSARYTTSRLMNTGVAGGYIHTFVLFKRFFLTTGINIGFGYQHNSTRYEMLKRTRDHDVLVIRNELDIILGYNYKRFFAALTSNTDIQRFGSSKEIELERGSGLVKLSLGYRFVNFKPLKRFFNKD